MTIAREPKPFNTRRLQIFELNFFMLLEYGAVFDGVCFTDAETCRQYSFEQAVELFNSREDKDLSDFACSEVKLRYSKKKKKIICTSHLVKLCEPFVEAAAADGVEPIDLLKASLRTLRLR